MEEKERIAVLEEKVSNLEETLKEVDKKLDEIKGTMTQYKGFLGGIMFVGSCVGVFLSFGKDWLFKKFGV